MKTTDDNINENCNEPDNCNHKLEYIYWKIDSAFINKNDNDRRFDVQILEKMSFEQIQWILLPSCQQNLKWIYKTYTFIMSFEQFFFN